MKLKRLAGVSAFVFLQLLYKAKLRIFTLVRFLVKTSYKLVTNSPVSLQIIKIGGIII